MRVHFHIVFGLMLFFACRSSEVGGGGGKAVHQWVELRADSLVGDLQLLDSLTVSASVETLKTQFHVCRYRYKQLEGVCEYFYTGISKRVNGPALPDVRTDDNQVFPPYGFQVIEQCLWDSFHDGLRQKIRDEVRRIQIDIRYLQTQLAAQTVLSRHVRELIHQQLIRIATLGQAGFDTPLSGDFQNEAAASLQGIYSLLVAYSSAEKGATLPEAHLFKKATELLKNNDTLDLLHLLTDVLMPLSEQLRDMPFPETEEDRTFGKVFRGTLADLLTGKGFSPDQYSGYADGRFTEEKRLLGEKLFYEPVLSKSATISCGSCHKPEQAFTDGLVKAANLVHGGNLPRNTPTLFYSSLQARQFYDLRSGSLEDQVDQVMHHEDEFGWNAAQAAQKINTLPKYSQLIRQAYRKDTLDALTLRNALATYLRSLNPFRSAFDAYMRGDRGALSMEQQRGFALFMGKAKCGTCHFLPIFNGTIPPGYTRTESEVIGVPDGRLESIDPDPGRYTIHAVEPFRFAFKTPTVRNAERTSPYMHNGVFSTMEQVVSFYVKGGGQGMGFEVPNQTLPFDSLRVSGDEQKALLAFMKALTDR
jgi:cytochrome c peroxidase